MIYVSILRTVGEKPTGRAPDGLAPEASLPGWLLMKPKLPLAAE